MMIALFILLAFVFVDCLIVDRVYRAMPLNELRRRARAHHSKQSANLYKVMAYGPSLELLLWLSATISGISLIVWATRDQWWLGAISGLSASILLVGGRASQRAPEWQVRYVILMSPLLGFKLDLLQPVLAKLSQPLKNLRPPHPPTGIYEKEDLLDLLKYQSHQVDNRLSGEELKIVQGALSFGSKTVASVMAPRRSLKMVVATDIIGPLLMDELHASGFKRFLVVKGLSRSANPDIIGSLHLSDLVGRPEGGKVKDVMKPHVYYINETQDLASSLAAFLKTHSQLLVVVNSFEEVVGALAIEDVLEQILGKKLSDDFDGYDNLRSVAGRTRATEKQH